jgi:DNA-binding winged helix-turn-helix (wHTH) protein
VASEPVRLSDSIQFGDGFALDLRTYELRRAGRVLKLERIPMELLLLLIEERGQLVTRDQIILRVLPIRGMSLDLPRTRRSDRRRLVDKLPGGCRSRSG